MATITRRTALGGALATLVAASGCGKESSGNSSGGATGPTTWWDGGQPQAELAKELAAEHADEWGEVQVTYQENTKIGQALQLAHQSGQLPDITAIGGLGIPIAQLVDQGWFRPLELDDAATTYLEENDLLTPGLQVFDGKPYTFPVNLPGNNTNNWFHIEALEKAGLDPADPPATYDEFRQACRKVVQGGGEMQGLLLPLKVAGTNAARVDNLAQCAGFEGQGGQLFRTGEYAFDSDEWVDSIEFLMSLTRDKLMFSGNSNATVKDGQARWAAGATAFFFDGPWIPGNIELHYPKLQGKIGSGPALVPDSSHQPTFYTNPPAGYYYVAATSKHPEVANKIMSSIASADYQTAYAGIMAHLPLDQAVLNNSEADPSYKEVAKRLYDQIFRAPMADVGNIDVAAAQAVIKPVEPDAGTVIQGYFSGDVTDLRGELKKVSDASQMALDEAIKAASARGANVSMDDWIFPNWEPRADYTSDMYAAR